MVKIKKNKNVKNILANFRQKGYLKDSETNQPNQTKHDHTNTGSPPQRPLQHRRLHTHRLDSRRQAQGLRRDRVHNERGWTL